MTANGQTGPAAPGPRAVALLSGRTLRYAETDGGRGLRRLGAATFDVDAERAVLRDGDPAALAAVADALTEGLGGTAAPVLIVAVHPTATTTFFTPLPAGLAAEARDGQIRQEAALLADLSPTQAVRVRAAAVRTEPGPDGPREWFHAVHVDEPVHARLSLLADALGVPTYDVADTTRAVAAALAADAASGPAGRFDLAVGVYGRHTEVAVVQGGAFVFGTHRPTADPADTAYLALAALHQAGGEPSALGRVWTYGDAATDDRLALVAEFTGATPSPLDPFAGWDRRPQADPAELAAFGPVLGATQ